MQRMLMMATTIGLGLMTPTLFAADAQAKQRGNNANHVTACSRSGFDCTTARLIKSPVGPKLVLRGGAKIDCSYDCRDTLRRNTVDFWEDRMLNGG